MAILTCYNIKGGVGKTTIATNIAYSAAEQGYRVLLVDLDPQGAASFYFGVDGKKGAKGKWFISASEKLNSAVRATEFEGLYLLPSNESQRELDLLLNDKKKSRSRLTKTFKPLADQYDLVVIDAAPGLTLVAENLFYLSDWIVVPTIPTPLSLRTLDQLNTFFDQNGHDKLKLLPVFNMVNSRSRLHSEMIDEIGRYYPHTLPGYLPLSTDVERMGIYQRPVATYAKNRLGGKALQLLWEELHKRIKKQIKKERKKRAG